LNPRGHYISACSVYAAVQAQKSNTKVKKQNKTKQNKTKHKRQNKQQQQQIQDILLHAVVLPNIALLVLLIFIA